MYTHIPNPYSKPDLPSVWQEVANSGAVYARTTINTNTFDLPSDFMNWNPTCHHKDLNNTAPGFLNLADDGNMKLLNVWGHSSEFDASSSNNNTDTWSIIQNFAASIQNRTDIWKTTNIEIYDYVMAQRQLVITDTYVFNPSNTDVYIKINGNAVKVLSGQTLWF